MQDSQDSQIRSLGPALHCWPRAHERIAELKLTRSGLGSTRGTKGHRAKHALRRLSEHPSKSCVPTYLSTKPTSAATVRPLQFIKSEQNTLGSFLPSNFPSKERGLKKNCDKEWQRNTSCTPGVGSNCYDVDMLLSSYDCTELIKGNKSQESRTSTNNTSKHIQIHSKHIQIHPEFAAVWTSEAKASCVDPPHLGSHFATGMDCSCVGWPWQKLEENYEEHVHLLQVLNNRRISETTMGKQLTAAKPTQCPWTAHTSGDSNCVRASARRIKDRCHSPALGTCHFLL